MAAYTPPLEFRISLPSDVTYKFGKSATSDGRMLSFRVNKQDEAIIRAACTVLGITPSNLIRHCAVKYSEKLLEHREEWIRRKVNEAKEHGPSG